MARPPHLVVDISAHGFGHLAMTAPVVDAIAARIPDLTLTIRCGLPAERIAQHVRTPFRHVDRAFDFGMAMVDALAIDVPATLDRYAAIHADWDRHLAVATEELAALQPTSLLGNIPYLSLAAARRAGIPALAFGCLHWAEVFHAYCAGLPGADRIEATMREAYAAADLFLRAAPALPMPGLPRVVDIGPVGRLGRVCRETLRERLGRPPQARVALLSTGGVDMALDVSRWPDLAGWTVVGGMPLAGDHPDVVPLAATGLSWIDAFASADAVVTKLGYGTVAEAGVNGIPVLHVPRPGWPEEPTLAAWISRHGRAAPLALEDFLAGRLVPSLEALVARPAPPRPAADGIAVAASAVVARLTPPPRAPA